MLRFILISIAALYVLFVAGLYFGQRALIFPAPAGVAPLPAGHEQVALKTADGLTLKAAYRAADAGKPTILFFHGNGGSWTGSAAATEVFAKSGYGILLPEYRGYGGNPGSPSEAGLYQDGRGAIAWLAAQGIEPADIVIIGNSIGGGVATQMAAEHPVSALILISPFASLSGLVQEKLWFVPARLLVKDPFENDRKIAKLAMPLLVQHGDADSLIPLSHAQRLKQNNSALDLQVFSGAGHDLAFFNEPQAKSLMWLEAQLKKAQQK
jgi:uncharacterized protein